MTREQVIEKIENAKGYANRYESVNKDFIFYTYDYVREDKSNLRFEVAMYNTYMLVENFQLTSSIEYDSIEFLSNHNLNNNYKSINIVLKGMNRASFIYSVRGE